jgi:hypothetical protein
MPKEAFFPFMALAAKQPSPIWIFQLLAVDTILAPILVPRLRQIASAEGKIAVIVQLSIGTFVPNELTS